MAGEVDALMVWDITELGNGVLDVVETAAWLHAQGVYLYARHPDDMESMTVQGRARLELIAHLAEFQAGIRRERAKGSGRSRRSTGNR
jgi:DNA invertase Pin-like site-specific DNA recombinase